MNITLHQDSHEQIEAALTSAGADASDERDPFHAAARDLWSAVKAAATASEANPSEPTATAEHPLEQMKRVLICGLYSESNGNCPTDTAEHMKQWESNAIMHFHCDTLFNAKVQFMTHAVMNCAKRFFVQNAEGEPAALTGHIVEIGDLQRPEGEPPVTGLVVRVPYEQLAAHKARLIFADVTITPNTKAEAQL